MKNKNLLSTSELAKMLGISRIAVFKKIKSGQIKAEKVGRNFVIEEQNISLILGNILSKKNKRAVEQAVDKTAKEYGETLRLLGRE